MTIGFVNMIRAFEHWVCRRLPGNKGGSRHPKKNPKTVCWESSPEERSRDRPRPKSCWVVAMYALASLALVAALSSVPVLEVLDLHPLPVP